MDVDYDLLERESVCKWRIFRERRGMVRQEGGVGDFSGLLVKESIFEWAYWAPIWATQDSSFISFVKYPK